MNVVNVQTSEVVFSSQGAGEYELSNREIIGFGGTASYDSTLNGKVLDLAIREAVNNLVTGIQNGGMAASSIIIKYTDNYFMKFVRHSGLLLAVALLAGCATAPKPLYNWDNYQSTIYQYYQLEKPALNNRLRR